MKLNIAGIIFALLIQTAGAADISTVVCEHSSGYKVKKNGNYVGDTNPLATASDLLTQTVREIPNKGQARFSSSFNGYVEVKEKQLSEMTLASTTTEFWGGKCGDLDTGPFDDVVCYQSTACMMVHVSYDACTKVTYDTNTGAKRVQCPSGVIIQ